MIAPLVPVLAGVFGLAIGSFLNVVVYRVPRGLSVVNPPSACPGCGNEIAARDNIPVLSWLLLRGRCRHCSNPISARYPAVEAITAIAFVVVGLAFAPRIAAAADIASLVAAILVTLAFLYLAAISVALAAIDLDVHRLPNAIVLPAYIVTGVLLGAAALLTQDASAAAWAAGGAAAYFGFYLLLALLKPGGMGMGDVKLAGVLGLCLGFLGPAQLVVGAFAAFLLGGVAGIIIILAGRGNRGSAIPFGPWMLAGAWTAILAGEPLAELYLRLTGLGE